MTDELQEALNKDQRDIQDLENQLRSYPQELSKEDTYSDEVEIPTNIDAVMPNSLSPVFKQLRKSSKKEFNSGSSKKPDYGERMRNALKQSYN